MFICQRRGPGKVSLAAPRSFPRWKQANLRGNHSPAWSKAGMCFSLPQFITALFDFPTLSLRFIDISMAEFLLQVVYPNNDSIHHLFNALLRSRH